MASTDTRSGFRLPWSSDRSQDPAAEGAADTEAVADAESEAPAAADPAWPQSDFNAALGLTRTQEQRPLEATQTPTELNEESSPMVDMDTAVAPAPAAAAPRKSSRMMVDLTAAIRATADTAQAQTLEQVHSESAQVVEAIRGSSTDGVTTLKQQSEDDIAAIREWSKAEIARIKDETDARITTRKATLEDELAGHAAAVDRRVDEVRAEVVRFEAAMTAYREGLEREDDPARLATMAEELPELPTFAAWADLGTLDISLPPVETEADAPEPEAIAEVVEAEVVQAEVETLEASVETLDAEAIAERIGETGAPVEDWYAPAEEGAESDDPASASDSGVDAWGDSPELQPTAMEVTGDEPGDDVPRWAAGDVPEGFPTGEGEEAGDPVDRGAIMAALEAAAEAVVAAEAAADSAETAEAAADVAETAAELLVGRQADELDYDPEAAAAMAARVDAGGYETETFSERLASLMPGHGEGEAGDEPRTTQVVVSGLVSVASIASFKRHLGRLPGVQAVAVASGPEGEFVFNVTHRADLSFRDVIPTMPGFAARVTGSGEGTLQVAARDPEAEA